MLIYSITWFVNYSWLWPSKLYIKYLLIKLGLYIKIFIYLNYYTVLSCFFITTLMKLTSNFNRKISCHLKILREYFIANLHDFILIFYFISHTQKSPKIFTYLHIYPFCIRKLILYYSIKYLEKNEITFFIYLRWHSQCHSRIK